MKPFIGIVAHTDMNKFKMPAVIISLAYITAIEKAGGAPLILPYTGDRGAVAEMASRVHGFLFPGGHDVDPVLYNEQASKALGVVDKDLDLFQMTVLDLAITRRKPVLAICRGMQIVNVALGGTLFQDIPSQFDTPTLEHTQQALHFDTDHPIDITPGSRLFDLFGPRILVNSRHHQSIKKSGSGIEITARAPDGVVEAAEHKHLPIVLVQWHPELMMQKNNDMLPLFKLFVKKCRI